MKFKINLLVLLFLACSNLNAQDWKTYPYVPAGSLVSFPVDEGRHSGEPIEWWYTAGHLTGQTTGKSYSYMFTFFHYPESGFDGFRILNVTDDDTGVFYQDVFPLNYTTLSTTGFDIEADIFLGATEHWRNKLDGSNMPIPFEYELYATSGTTTLDLELITLKRPLILGDDGYLDQGLANYTYYYSQTKNSVTGSITAGGITENVIGTGWIDRQYGDFNPLTGEKYEWFSMQLSNGMDINLWNIFTAGRTIPNTPEYRILSAYVDENNQYTTSDFTIERLGYFCTPDEVNCYSRQWRLTSPTNNIDLTLTGMHTTTEVQQPFRFFEGSISVSGTVGATNVTGIGFAELLHTYEDPSMTITAPVGGFYDNAMPITWTLDNPDDGRPITYDLEYSIDDQNTFLPIVQNLTSPSYIWNSPPINEGDDVWFKIIGNSVDNTLTNEVISASSSSATLSLSNFNPNGIKMYPNPVYDVLHLEFDQNLNNLHIEVIDINGKLLYVETNSNVRSQEISMESFSNGLYFVRLWSDEMNDFLRVVKK
ncbi:MAG: T9SS type A sorting domain-containing protein [Flavobacteriaceae bacterium]|nr:T9SS type A sorting domain-containing protein [Flavobacteriaceae bacterium]